MTELNFNGYIEAIDLPLVIQDIELIDGEIKNSTVTKALGLKKTAELKIKRHNNIFDGQITLTGGNTAELENAIVYTFTDIEAMIILNPLGNDEYQVFFMYADERHRPYVCETLKTLHKVAELANFYLGHNEAEKKLAVALKKKNLQKALIQNKALN